MTRILYSNPAGHTRDMTGKSKVRLFSSFWSFLGESKSSYKVFGKDALASLDWSGEASWGLAGTILIFEIFQHWWALHAWRLCSGY